MTLVLCLSIAGCGGKGPSGALNGEEYGTVVPADCVYTDNEGTFVYRLTQTEDGWKTEHCTVRIEATDGTHAAIRRIVSEEILLAASPSVPLSDGQIVKLVNETIPEG